MVSHSRDALRPRFSGNFSPSSNSEGAGNAGCALHPRSRVRSAQNKMHTSIQGSGEHPTFPAQWLYGLYRALPGERAFLPPSSPISFWPLRNLTPATGRQDHTTSPYAQAALVVRNLSVHRNPSNVRDDGRRPLSGTGWMRYAGDLGVASSVISVNRKLFRGAIASH
jgi:hypothetical protein